MAQSNKLKWRFDVNTFRLLGRDLITDRITALFELVKNSYDANAQNVNIQFLDVGTRNDNSKIIIKDDGIGMSLDDIQNKWMVIGTHSKRKDLFSPDPYNRRYIGEKGIGRFAVDKLGQYVRIRTKREEDEKELVVTINWQDYQDLADETQLELKLFTEVENEFEFIEPTFKKGTILEIFVPREIWELKDIEQSFKELTHLVSPFHEAKYPFNIWIFAPEYSTYSSPKFVQTDEKNFASHSFSISYNEATNEQEYLFFDKLEKKVTIKKCPEPSFGFIQFHLNYFDEEAKNRFRTNYKGTSIKIDGIKVYRDGILTTPFAELEGETIRRRDVLGIDKRRRRDIFEKISASDVIGYIEITKDGNPKIIDATNRQDFLYTPEYINLKDFIYTQLDTFMETRKVIRIEAKQKKENTFDLARETVKKLKQNVNALKKSKNNKNEADTFDVILGQLSDIEKGFEGITSEYQENKKEEERKEKMYFSLMSLSLFAANISHAVRTTIYSIKDDAVYIQNKISDDGLKSKAGRINREIQRLLKVVDFMLKYAKTDLPAEYFNVKELINNVFDAHETIFIQKRISIKLDIEQKLSLYGNQVFFQDIITNLISNSIKALEGNFTKEINCTAAANAQGITILFSDNGIGIPENKREWVFGMYNTTTQEQGGAGIGLYVVKTNIEALGGEVFIENTEKQSVGATFKIIIPFKK
jgi:signal transduction histidine kinase